MITKECKTEKICLFCVNEYHLEMILLPYIKERLNNSKFIIFTEDDLEETINVLLTKLNLKDEINDKIKSIGWKSEKKIDDLKKYIQDDKKTNIIINGSYNYIKRINKAIENSINENIIIIDCFHVGDTNVNIEEISTRYSYILNTQKL